MAEAVGVLEVYGLVTAFVAADAGCKAANVRIETFDNTKPAQDEDIKVPLWVTVKFRGSVADVTEAIEAGVQAADQMAGVVRHYVIPNPTEGTEKMLKLSGLDEK